MTTTERFCTGCPDHEACATGWPCDAVRAAHDSEGGRETAEADRGSSSPSVGASDESRLQVAPAIPRPPSALTDGERDQLRGLGQGQVPAVVESIIAARVDRLESALRDIAADHKRQTDTWHHRGGRTDSAQRWHDGYVTACASHSIKARAALDPDAAAEDEQSMRLAAEGTDAEWYEETGHCGSCGDVGTNCGCDGKCGCFRLHGPRKEPYRSPGEKIAAVKALADFYAEHPDEIAGRGSVADRIRKALGEDSADDPLPLATMPGAAS